MSSTVPRPSPPAASWRRATLAACLALALPAGLSALHSARAATAIVLNSDDDSLSVIDGDSYRETSRTYIGRGPHHLMLTPDRKDLIIAMSGGNELAFIDRITGAISERVEASDPYQIGFSPDAKWFVAASLRLDRIDIYDAKTYRVVYRLPAATMPSHIAFALDSSAVYVTLQGTNSLIAIALDTGKVLWTVPIGRQPAGIMMRRSGTLLVAVMGADYVAEVEPRDGSIIRKIHTGIGAHNFLLTPDGKTLYVSNRIAGTISILDADTLDVTGTILAPGGPDDMVLSPDGSELWATSRWRRSVDVVGLAAGKVKATIAVGRSPHGIFIY